MAEYHISDFIFEKKKCQSSTLSKIMNEKKLAAHYGVRFTPTMQFFPKKLNGIADKAPKDREIARLPGYIKPPHFLAMLKFVGEEAYKTQSFKAFLDTNPLEL